MNNLFCEKLAFNLDQIEQRVSNGKPGMIIIEGGLGEGKTTLAAEIVDYINQKRGLPPLNFKSTPQIAFGGEDFKRKLGLCYEKKLPIIIYDEAGDYSKRKALTKFNQLLNRTFETFRAFKIIVILCLPSFFALDSSLFDNEVPQLLLKLYDRNSKSGHYCGYSLNNMKWLRFHLSKRKFIKDYTYLKTKPNFIGRFENLPEDRAKDLDQMTTNIKLKILKNNETETPQISEKLMGEVQDALNPPGWLYKRALARYDKEIAKEEAIKKNVGEKTLC